MPRFAPAFACALLLALVPALCADIVVLKRGGKVEGVVRDLGDTVEVRTKTGALKIKKDEIQEIITQKTPEDQYREKREALAPGDVDGRLALADFCRGNGLIDEMGEVLKMALDLAPANDKVVAKWREYQKSFLRVPMTPQEERALASRFGPGFHTVRTSHWVLVYDVDDIMARARVNTLEKVYQTFYVYFEKEKFELGIPGHPLEAVLFAREADYLHVAPAGSSGVYIHDHNRLYLFNAENAQIQAQTRESLKIVAKNIKILQGVIRDSNKPAEVEQARQDLAEQKRLERKLGFQSRPFSDRGVFETMVHEATHQLCFNSGLLPLADIPTWLTEGLAVYFEKFEQWSGPIGSPGQVQADKLNDIHDAIEDGALVSLKELLAVGISKGLLPYGERAGLAYAESWGLVYYMMQARGTQYRKPFFDYIKALEVRCREGKLEKDLRGQFLTDMGLELTELEKSWIDYMKNLR